MDASFFEQFGGGAGGGFLGVLLGYLMQRRALEDLKIEMATKASQHEVDALKDITDGLVREKTCIARTDGLLKAMTEKIDGINDKLATRIDGAIQRIDNSSRRFDKLDDKLNNVRDLLLVPLEERKKVDKK